MNNSAAALIAGAPSVEVAHALLGLVQKPASGYGLRTFGLFRFADAERYLTTRQYGHAAYVVGSFSDPADIDKVAASTRNPQVLRAICWNSNTSWSCLRKLCGDNNQGVQRTARKCVGWRLNDGYFGGSPEDLDLIVEIGDGPLPVEKLLEMAEHESLPSEVLAVLLGRDALPEQLQMLVARFGDRSALSRLSYRSDLTVEVADHILYRWKTDFSRTKLIDTLVSDTMLASEQVRATHRRRRSVAAKGATLNSPVPLPAEERSELLDQLLYCQHTLHGDGAIRLEAIARPVWTREDLDKLDAACAYHVIEWPLVQAVGLPERDLVVARRPSLLNPLRSREEVLSALSAETAIFGYFNENLTDMDRSEVLRQFGGEMLRRIIRDAAFLVRCDVPLMTGLVEIREKADRRDRWLVDSTLVSASRYMDIPTGVIAGATFADMSVAHMQALGLARCVTERFGANPEAWVMFAQLAGSWQCTVSDLLDAVESLI